MISRTVREFLVFYGALIMNLNNNWGKRRNMKEKWEMVNFGACRPLTPS